MKSLFKRGQKSPKVRLELCQNNLDRFYTEDDLHSFANFLEHKGLKPKEYQCLNNCSQCRMTPYVKMNGRLLLEQTPQELLRTMELHVTNK
ncbi:DUF1450 domain-containing protein [Bacillus massiliglaciei]|uniref:DUF1450 domain-containing protein n=1 Tax=Bacillus massiliglaciei TaxID=1816693 RepID=UPI000DA62C79